MFSTSQLNVRGKNLKNMKFMIELVETEKDKVIARSKHFELSGIMKSLVKTGEVKNLNNLTIKFNNLAVSQMGKQIYYSLFS